MKKHYKAVILVLASDNSPIYQEFRKIYQRYLNECPDVKVLLVYGAGTLFERQEYDLVYDDIVENYYPGMITKTLRAMEHIDQTYDYDFLIRTNLSTFWDFTNLLKRLEVLPSTNCIAGSRIWNTVKGVKSSEYIAGVNLVLSRDLVIDIIANASEVCSWNNIAEDQAISQYFTNNGVLLQPHHPTACQRIHHITSDTTDLIMVEVIKAQKLNRDNFRLKNKDRNIDLIILQLLLKEYYDKTVTE